MDQSIWTVRCIDPMLDPMLEIIYLIKNESANESESWIRLIKFV